MNKKRVLVLLLVCAWTPALPAQVILPESGYLAGPLDPAESQLGDEFFNFPDALGERPRPGESPLTGWIEFIFEPVPDDPDRAAFTFTYDNAGPTDMWSFENGQTWLVADNRAFSNPMPGFSNQGILNLRTGRIEAITVNPVFQNSTIAEVTRNNRIPYAFTPTYPFGVEAATALIGALPPELVPVLVPPQLLSIEPGFLFSEAFFTYGTDGRITGFNFFGWTAVPVGLTAYLNPQLVALGASPFPGFSFGLNGEFFFANPYACPPDTFCPTSEVSPDGLPLAPTAFFRPYFILGSKELAPAAPPPATPPDCAPEPRTGSLLIAYGDRLYQIGGRTAEGVTDRVDVYDPATGAWEPGPPLRAATADAQGGVIGSKIYVYGGHDPRGGIRRQLQIFDPAAGRWSRGDHGPFGVAKGAAAVSGESLYVIGGRSPGDPRYNFEVLIYHAASPGLPAGWDEMDVAPERLPVLADGASAVAVGPEIYVLGGLVLDAVTGMRSVTRKVFIFSTVSRRFEEGPELAWGVYEASAGRLGNRIYLSGGRRTNGGRSTSGVQVLEIGQEKWVKARPMLFPVADAGGASANGEIFVAGGRSQDGNETRVLQTLGGGRGWSLCGSQPIFVAADVLNAAALTVGPRALSPGSLAVVTGYNLDRALGVTVDGRSAPIVAGPAAVPSVNSLFTPHVLPERAYFQVPAGLSGATASIALPPSPAVEVAVAGVGPGIFLEAQDEVREPRYLDTASALACNQDGTLNYAANPARPGETVTLRTTGLGTGPSPAALNVIIDGIPTSIQSVMPGTPSGLWEVVVVVPAVGRSANRLPVQVELLGVPSNRAALAVLRVEDEGMLVRGRIPLPCHSPIPAG